MRAFMAIQCLLALTQFSRAAFIALPHTNQYHIQDALGQYSYGYSGGPSAKHESKSADGRTTGAYSYVDANGAIQSVNYVADPVNGFRVAHTNLPAVPVGFNSLSLLALSPLANFSPFAHISPIIPFSPIASIAPIAPAPKLEATAQPTPQPEEESIPEQDDEKENGESTYIQDTPEVIEAKAAHLKAHAEATAAATQGRTRRSVAVISPSIFTFASPIVASSQYNIQDDLGQYSYGYADINSAKSESRAIDGTTNGAYSYVDGDGLIQSVQYTAGSEGFRVAATNLPGRPTSLAAIVPAVVPAISSDPAVIAAPQGPLETPEVIAAKVVHFAAHEKANVLHFAAHDRANAVPFAAHDEATAPLLKAP